MDSREYCCVYAGLSLTALPSHIAVKVAVQVLAPLINTVVELDVPEQSPLQPVKVDPLSAVAVTV
jgi:hypothetical protein